MISINDIECAADRLKHAALHTPLQYNHALSDKYGADIYLKREDMQMVRSFKIRGAYNKLASLNESEKSCGIVCASAGNHAQGVASACAQLKITGVIYMPSTTPKQKINKVVHFGGKYIQVILTGDTFDDAQQEAVAFCQEKNSIYIHPFDDPLVMAGQGTIGQEMVNDLEKPLDYLLVAVGGGGLLSGVGSYFREKSPATNIIAVEAEGAPAFAHALKEKKPVSLPKIDAFADGIAVKKVGEQTFEICSQVTQRVLLVPEGKICTSILELYNDQAIVAEPAGAISVAALDFIAEEIKGKRVGIIICGGNNDITRTADIQERSLLYEGKKHYFIINFPQRAGALKDFLQVLGPDDDITHFEYTKKKHREAGPAIVGIELKYPDDYDPLIKRMKEQKIRFIPLNDNPMLFEMLI